MRSTIGEADDGDTNGLQSKTRSVRATTKYGTVLPPIRSWAEAVSHAVPVFSPTSAMVLADDGSVNRLERRRPFMQSAVALPL